MFKVPYMRYFDTPELTLNEELQGQKSAYLSAKIRKYKMVSRMVKETEANLCLAILGKNSKIQNGRHFWGGENFLKIAKSTFLRYPVGRKFRRNRSISHG